MNDFTEIAVEQPDTGFTATMTWIEFVMDNEDDPDLIADIEAQLADCNYAEIGGGATPLVWVFA